MRTHWLYIRDLCMRYLGRRGRNKRREVLLSGLCLPPPGGTSGTRNQVILFPECWHPDDASSPLARTQVSAWMGQVPVPLFSEKGTGRPEPMTQWGWCAASLTSSNIPLQLELDPAFRAPQPGGLLGDRPSRSTPEGPQDGILPLPPASGLACCFSIQEISICL